MLIYSVSITLLQRLLKSIKSTWAMFTAALDFNPVLIESP